MFLSILTLLQTNMPCSVNYYRYKNNYEKYVGEDGKEPTKPGEDDGSVVKSIASPRLMSKLSPISQFVKNQGINVNPMSQKGLLKYAMNTNKIDNAKIGDGGDSDSGDERDISGFKSKKETAAQKAARQKELDDLKKLGNDVIDTKVAGAIRLPNRISKGMTIDPNTGTAKQGNDRDVIMSPTSFLRGAASPRLSSFVAANDENSIQFEGEMIRKATETKLKKYWYCLLGKELYVYKN